MQFALTHDAKSCSRYPVNRDIERHAALAFRARKFDASKHHVALLTEVFPDRHGLVRNRCKSFVPNWADASLSQTSAALMRGIGSAAVTISGVDLVQSSNRIEIGRQRSSRRFSSV